MTTKDAFSDKEWAFLVTFPYRVGLWMAHLDEGGGQRAKEAEMKALSGIILTVEKKYSNIPLLLSLTQATVDLAQNTAVAELAIENADSIIGDIKKLLELLKKQANKQEINVYKILLIDVAEAVAKAAEDRNFGTQNFYGGPEKENYEGLKRSILAPWFFVLKYVRLGRGPKVSRKEKEAINELIDALKANEIVQKWELDPQGTSKP